MKRVLPLLLILIFGTLCAVLLLNPSPQAETATSETLPPLALQTRDGMTLHLPRLGQPAIINVFASWCGPCAAEMPLLLQLKGTGVAIYGIAYKDQPEALAGFLQRYADPFTAIAMDDGNVAVQLGITGVPESYLMNAAGQIVRHAAGMLDRAQLADWQAEIATWQ